MAATKLRIWLPLLALVWLVNALPLAQAAPSLAPLAPVAAPEGEAESLRSFNAEDAALAYELLLGAGDLERAFLVAQQAVQVSPNDLQWRRKLAQVSDWTKRPDAAAQQWLALFALGDRTQDTLDAVIRLAPLAGQPLLAVQALAELAKWQPLTVGVLERYGDLALGQGQYAAAATYYFMARDHAESIVVSRRLFQSAVRALMAASLYKQAMEEARLRVGDLASDPDTLRFLARTALIAGDPVAAANYARKLVFK